MTHRIFSRTLPLGILFLVVTVTGGLWAGYSGIFSDPVQSGPVRSGPVESNLVRYAHFSTEENRSNDLIPTRPSVSEWLPPLTRPTLAILEVSSTPRLLLDDRTKTDQTEIPQFVSLVSDEEPTNRRNAVGPTRVAPTEQAPINREIAERITLELAPRTNLLLQSPLGSPPGSQKMVPFELQKTPPNDSLIEVYEPKQTDEESIIGPDLGYIPPKPLSPPEPPKPLSPLEPAEPPEPAEPAEPPEPLEPLSLPDLSEPLSLPDLSEPAKLTEPRRLESAPTGRISDSHIDLMANEPSPIGPIPQRPRVRSRSLELAAREADTHSREGFELAGRKAYFAAKAELIRALRLIAQALDTEMQTGTHSRALASGLTAMKESEDFLPRGRQMEADLDIVGIIRNHQTPVLHDAKIGTMTPLSAIGTYLTYAQEQLAVSVDAEISGSMALLGLGKLHAVMAKENLTMVQSARPKAMAIFQASLLSDPQNSMASNELGVLLARTGRFKEARLALEHSLSIQHRDPTGWRNLAIVYQQLRRPDLAQRAQQLAANTRHAAMTRLGHLPNTPHGQIQWVPPVRFAQTGDQTLRTIPTVPQPIPTRTLPTVQNPIAPLRQQR